MRVTRLSPPPRVTFVAEPRGWLNVPLHCDWAEATHVEVRAEDWGRACAEAARTLPEITFLIAPGCVDAEALRALPGLKIGVVLPPVSDPAAITTLTARACVGGYDGCTWFETLPHPLRGMRFAQVLPPVVDVERALSVPRLDRCTIVAPTGALPHGLGVRGEVAWLDKDASSEAVRSALFDAGVFACWSEPRDVRIEALAVAALASGLLVVSNRELPAEWGIEVEDEYLVRSRPEEFAAVVSSAAAARGSFAPLRARAWQKVRESLSASSAFERLAHDALLELADGAHARGGHSKEG